MFVFSSDMPLLLAQRELEMKAMILAAGAGTRLNP
jgi:hypothetical protein